jgi:hypothetical protein
MTIKQLQHILAQAPDPSSDVYIPHTVIMPTSQSVHQESSTSIGYNFDDNNNLDLYVIDEE